jgi:hypothetical protein
MAELHPLATFLVGDTFPIEGYCRDADGDPLDLSGAQAIEWKLETAQSRRCEEWETPQPPTVVLDLTLGNGIAITNAPLGQIVITITSAQSAALAPGRYRDQLRVILASGVVSYQWVGFIEARPSF